MSMANVFGKPVTGGTPLERAEKAYNDANADGKRDAAVAYVKKKKSDFGNGVSTLSIFYNATGAALTFYVDRNIYGKIYDAYPLRVQNGQWGAFLHIKSPIVASGSVAYVIYRGKSPNGDYCNLLLGWDNPLDQATQFTHAYCDILDDRSKPNPEAVYKEMEAATRQHTVSKKSMFVSATIEEDTSPLYEAILTLEDV